MIAALALLSGCISNMPNGMFAPKAKVREQRAQSDARFGQGSDIIQSLQMRPSVIEPGTPYGEVARAVIASDARVAEADLRVARLRADAAKRNWLPRIGPRVSLTSLGDFVASLLIEQVIFDNGRKRAERDLAAANVEMAAVTLIDDGNKRVHDALSLYVQAQENRELSERLARAIRDMSRFEWVMQKRVEGGVSDRSDLNILSQKLAAMRARKQAAEEGAGTALAELNIMAALDLGAVQGLGGLRPAGAAEPLDVIRARAERARALAQSRIARAAHLPGLAATGTVDREGNTLGALEIRTDSLFSLGTGAELKALRISRESADRQVLEARELAARRIEVQQNRLVAYQRQLGEAARLTKQAKANLDLFQAQYEGGQRQVMDVVGVYETWAQALETELALKYKAARAELELARLRGALAEGSQL